MIGTAFAELTERELTELSRQLGGAVHDCTVTSRALRHMGGHREELAEIGAIQAELVTLQGEALATLHHAGGGGCS